MENAFWRAEPQSRSLRTCIEERRVAEIRIYAIGTGNPWGHNQPYPKEFDKDRAMDDLIRSYDLKTSRLQKVYDVYEASRVLSIDCRDLGYIHDGQQYGHKGHIGTNDLLIEQVVQFEDGMKLRKLFGTFWENLENISVETLERPVGLALVLWDEYGKHKSPAVASILYYCLKKDGWKMHTAPGEEVTMLSSILWYKGSCGKDSCDGCDAPIGNRENKYLNEAYELWETSRDSALRNT